MAHIDLIIGPRGSAAESAFCNALTNNKDGFTSLLAVVAPNLMCKPNTVMFNKVTIKGAKHVITSYSIHYTKLYDPAGFAVSVEAPARLHLGFIDLNGGLGRRFGSVGLTLEGLATRVTMAPAEHMSVEGPGAERVVPWMTRLAELLGVPPEAQVEVEQTVPAHAGLGSGTQLAIAVGVAFARLHVV